MLFWYTFKFVTLLYSIIDFFLRGSGTLFAISFKCLCLHRPILLLVCFSCSCSILHDLSHLVEIYNNP